MLISVSNIHDFSAENLLSTSSWKRPFLWMSAQLVPHKVETILHSIFPHRIVSLYFICVAYIICWGLLAHWCDRWLFEPFSRLSVTHTLLPTHFIRCQFVFLGCWEVCLPIGNSLKLLNEINIWNHLANCNCSFGNFVTWILVSIIYSIYILKYNFLYKFTLFFIHDIHIYVYVMYICTFVLNSRGTKLSNIKFTKLIKLKIWSIKI